METARTLWRTLEMIHAAIYFSPIAMEAYEKIGLGEPGFNYFAPRSAAMGAVDGGTVAGAFYFWRPDIVRRFLPAAWEIADPSTVIEARWGAAKPVLLSRAAPVITDDSAAEAAELLALAMSAAPEPGRPVYGGHTAVPAPDDPVTAVWHWATLYREYRGDGHVAVLQSLGIGPIEALLLNIGTGYWAEERQRRSRGWRPDDWETTRARLLDGGLLTERDDGLALTSAGAELVDEIEQSTNQLSVAPWQALGPDGGARIVELLEPWAQAIDSAGGVSFSRPAQ